MSRFCRRETLRALEGLEGKMDIVLADAPCSGSGVWRRRPDAKWRLTAEALAARVEEQRQVLTLAASLVKPGGRLVYATCSVIAAENADQTRWFLAAFPEFKERAWRDLWPSSAPDRALGFQRRRARAAAYPLPSRHGWILYQHFRAFGSATALKRHHFLAFR